ncbi:MAG: ImmA/IrrE family metallo-endopeptidase [Sutterella sp.]
MPEAAALALLANWDGSLPIDPTQIAERCGLHVRPEPSLQEIGLSGYLDGPNCEILVNPREPEPRRRFTIAHELGHYILGHGSANRGNSRSNCAQIEINANKFAAELLMPASVLRRYASLPSMELCEKFGVSAMALEYRLRNLGLI